MKTSDTNEGLVGCFVLLAILCAAAYFFIPNRYTSCGGVSSYGCAYLNDEAPFDVYYWRNLDEDDEDDNNLIGSVRGLAACRDRAIQEAKRLNEAWNHRAYVCQLRKNGRYTETHRFEDFEEF